MGAEEGRFLDEFILWHWLSGFSKIYLYVPVQEPNLYRLAPYVAAGLLKLHSFESREHTMALLPAFTYVPVL